MGRRRRAGFSAGPAAGSLAPTAESAGPETTPRVVASPRRRPAGCRAGHCRTDGRRGAARRRRGERRGADLQPVADRRRVPGDGAGGPDLADDLVSGGPVAAQQQRAHPIHAADSRAARWCPPGVQTAAAGAIRRAPGGDRRPSTSNSRCRPWRRRWCCGWNRASSGSRTTRPAGCRRRSTTRTATSRAAVTLTGRDPEGLVRFFFSPGVLDVPPGGTASAARA